MNFILTNKNISKITFILITISLLWVSIFSLLYHTNNMTFEGTKSDCLFSNKSNKGCAMNFEEHVNLWKGMVTSLPKDNIELMYTLALLLIIFIIFDKNYFSEFSWRVFSRFKLYIKQHPQIKRFNYLIEIFSRGILNTKIYKIIKI